VGTSAAPLAPAVCGVVTVVGVSAKAGADEVGDDFLSGALLLGRLVDPGVGRDGAMDNDEVALAEALDDVLAERAEGFDAVPGGVSVLPGPSICRWSWRALGPRRSVSVSPANS
jgi:hypothetical protein